MQEHIWRGNEPFGEWFYYIAIDQWRFFAFLSFAIILSVVVFLRAEGGRHYLKKLFKAWSAVLLVVFGLFFMIYLLGGV